MLRSTRKSVSTKPATLTKSASHPEMSWSSSSEHAPSQSMKLQALKSPSAFSNRIKKKELVNLASQLAIMTKSGVDLATALQSLVRQCSHPTLKPILTDIHENVLGGKRVSESLAQ